MTCETNASRPPDKPAARRNQRLARHLVCTAGLAAFALAVLGHLFAEPLLFVERETPRADVIVVLGGDASDRPWKALELYRQDRAPAIFISGGDDYNFIRHRFEMAGVPTNSLCGEGRSRTTCENAEVSVPLLRARGARRVILVTSWYHSRRALACFRHFAPEIEFYSMPSYNGISMENKPGLSEAFYVFSEYLKTAWYVLRHGIWPTEGNR